MTEPANCFILADNPVGSLEDGDDAFQFRPFAETLATMALNKQNGTPFAVAIDGAWGTGKTSLMRMTQDILDQATQEINKTKDKKADGPQRRCKTFWFNAWKYSNSDSLLAALISVLFKEMKQDSNFREKINNNFDRKRIAFAFINKVFKIDISNIKNDLRVAKVAEFIDEFTDLTKMLIQSYCAKNPETDADDDSAGAFVIFIDDLDRCPPGRILQTFEAIKLFLDIPGCVFFLGMDIQQVRSAVEAEHKDRQGFEAGRYLEKIFQVHVKIPQVATGNMEQFLNGLLKENSGANGQISEDVQAILLGAEYETQRAIKRALNDFLFLKTLTEKMKNGPETTDTGLAKWIAVHTRDEKFAEALTTPDLFLLAAWETYRLNDTKNNILTWNKIDYKFDSNGDLILSDVQKESERQKALSASKSSDNGETEHPETDEALENDLHQRWSNFFNRWRHKPVFMYPFIKEGKRDFGNEDACKAYQHLNQYIAPAEPEQTKKSKDKTPRIVNGYTIEPGAFLEGADLKGADLEGANLKNAHLFAANLEEANLRSAKLFEADLIEAILITADLRRADLRVANLRGTDLFRADLMGASLREADLIGASLWEADLRRADLRTANFSHDEILKARNWDLAIYDAGVLERLKTLAGKME